MRSEVEYMSMEEQAAAGAALLAELNAWCGLEGADVARISRAIYKGTDCGAWLSVDAQGLHVGSIVEGADVDCQMHTLTWAEYLDMEEGDLRKWLNAALEEIEAEADEIWKEWNEDASND